LAAADTLLLAGGLDPAFYRAFVQNAYESPDRLEPVRRLEGPLRLYLRTTDEAGRAIDRATLAVTERVLIDSAPVWSGHQFGVAEVVRGAGTREQVSGWLTIKWSSVPAWAGCGRSTVGIDGGFIEFNAGGSCACGTASLVYPRLVRHELGHAMGYYHTDHRDDVMYGRPIESRTCDAQPSDREQRHARFLYSETGSGH
jgi:hypothetical protein